MIQTHARSVPSFERLMQQKKLETERNSNEQLRKRNYNQKLLANAIPMDSSMLEDSPIMNSNLLQSRQLEEERGFAFDVTEYSLKYDRCASISTWSDELAEDGESETVFKLQNFVLLRLYPTDKCNDNFRWGFGSKFGEYLIDMETYLQLRQEFYEEKLENYCAYCGECVGEIEEQQEAEEEEEEEEEEENQEEEEEQQDNGRRLEEAEDNEEENEQEDEGEQEEDNEGEEEQEGDDAMDDAIDDAMDDAVDDAVDDAMDDAVDDAMDDDGGLKWCYYACNNYEKKCADDDDNAFAFDEFYQCALYEGNDGTEMYLGPHCSNGKIVIGGFYDEFCSEYSSSISVASFTGKSLSRSPLSDFTSEECISCSKSKLPRYFDYEAPDDDAQLDVLELCENIYYGSAKCHNRIGSIYGTQNELLSEDNVCSFIKNIATNKYDEDGSIKLNAFDVSDITYAFNKVKDATIENGVDWTLVWLGVTCVGFAFYAGHLSRKLKMAEEGDIDWKDSWIVEARSAAGYDNRY